VAADRVLVSVVAVGGFQRQGAVGIALPAPAEINRIEDAADVVFPADAQSHEIVLAVTDIRKADLAQDRDVKGAWRAKAVDAKRVVRTILPSPFAMIDQAGRDFL